MRLNVNAAFAVTIISTTGTVLQVIVLGYSAKEDLWG